MVELSDFRKFMQKEFPALTQSQIEDICDASKGRIVNSTAPNRSLLIEIAGRYGYRGSGEKDREEFNNAKEFLVEKLAGQRLAEPTMEKLAAQVSARPKRVMAPYSSADLSMLDNPVAISGSWVDRMARELPKGYAVVAPPQTVHLDLPHGKRDVATPIHERERGDYSHLSPAEQRLRDTPLRMMVVRSPDGARFQVMNTPAGQITITPLSGQQANAMPNLYNPVPPGAMVSPNFNAAMNDLQHPQRKGGVALRQ